MNDLSHGRRNENSKHSFQNIAGSIDAKRHQVLNLIDGEKSTKEIADILGIEHHKISGRFSELKAKQKIILKTTKKIGNSRFSVYQKTNL